MSCAEGAHRSSLIGRDSAVGLNKRKLSFQVGTTRLSKPYSSGDCLSQGVKLVTEIIPVEPNSWLSLRRLCAEASSVLGRVPFQ